MVRSEPDAPRDNCSWWRLSLGDAIEATPVLLTVQQQFEQCWHEAGLPTDMSLWLRTDSDGLHCRQTLFFSPGCQRLAEPCHAVACAAPRRTHVQWLAGSQTALA